MTSKAPFFPWKKKSFTAMLFVTESAATGQMLIDAELHFPHAVNLSGHILD